jgi:hypothetical protein
MIIAMQRWLGAWIALACAACGRIGFGTVGSGVGDGAGASDVSTAGEVSVSSASCDSVAPGSACDPAWASLHSTLTGWDGWPGVGICPCDVAVKCKVSTVADLGTTQTLVAFSVSPRQSEEIWFYTSLDGTTWTQQFYANDGAVGDYNGSNDSVAFGTLGQQIGNMRLALTAAPASARYARIDMALNWCAYVGESNAHIYQM